MQAKVTDEANDNAETMLQKLDAILAKFFIGGSRGGGGCGTQWAERQAETDIEKASPKPKEQRRKRTRIGVGYYDTEDQGYELRPGDGVAMVTSGLIHIGVIQSIKNGLASVKWNYIKGVERIPIERLNYCPTPEQIKATCLEIQLQWTKTERRQRDCYGNGGEVLPHPMAHPECNTHRKMKVAAG